MNDESNGLATVTLLTTHHSLWFEVSSTNGQLERFLSELKSMVTMSPPYYTLKVEDDEGGIVTVIPKHVIGWTVRYDNEETR